MYIAVQTAIFIIGRPKVRASFFGIRGAQFRAPLNSSAQYYRDIRSVSGGGGFIGSHMMPRCISHSDGWSLYKFQYG